MAILAVQSESESMRKQALEGRGSLILCTVVQVNNGHLPPHVIPYCFVGAILAALLPIAAYLLDLQRRRESSSSGKDCCTAKPHAKQSICLDMQARYYALRQHELPIQRVDAIISSHDCWSSRVPVKLGLGRCCMFSCSASCSVLQQLCLSSSMLMLTLHQMQSDVRCLASGQPKSAGS